MDLYLELITLPVSDVDRAVSFYVERLSFTVEQDVQIDQDHRFVELTPPGSACSIALTTGYLNSKPGSVNGLQLNVTDIRTVPGFLMERGLNVDRIEDHPWGRFYFFTDPDGNGWSIHGSTSEVHEESP